MKKICLVLIGCFSLIFSPETSRASHGMGGEITWTCLGSGEFVFHMKFYRDCNGITPSSTIQMATNHPIGTITMNLVQQNDISPDGFMPDGSTVCPICSQGSFSTPIVGLVEEYIYESAPVFLPGVPPPTGWWFRWGECCRSAALTNLAVPGGNGFANRAVMYPYQGQNMGTCYDNSPYFAEKPSVIQCSNLSMNYQHLSFDAEYDSLAYAFANPIDDSGNNLAFAPGYSVTNPLPGTLTLNGFTGQMEYIPSQGGYFVLVVKVSSYKCGILVSEIYREINVVLNNSCPPVINAGISADNIAPVISAPFADPVTGLMTSFSDTVFAGDTVDFTSAFTDADLFTNNDPQSVTLTSFGTQYGAGYTDPAAGCLLPPCATLSNPPPYQAVTSGSENFNWVTAPIHLGLSMGCVNMANTYHFIWKANDNYCPANATNSEIISITVMPNTPRPQIITNGTSFSCSLTGSYTYQWYFNRFAIPGATAVSYTPTQSGTYHVLAVAPNGDGNYSDGFVYGITGISENSPLYHLSVTPNPSSDGLFSVSGEANHGDVAYHITDQTGRLIEQGVIHSLGNLPGHTLDLSAAARGIYHITMTDARGQTRVLKLVRL
jgi:hypothetical protein